MACWRCTCSSISTFADLDAIAGTGDHREALSTVAASFPGLELWIDPGVGTEAAARSWLENGAIRLVLGSESQEGLAALSALRSCTRVILSLDFRGEAFQGPPELFETASAWPQRVIVMSLARVGANRGPDTQRVAEVLRRRPGGEVYAAGGVRNRDDLDALRRIGAAGALVATALHAGALGAKDLESIARP